jgi:hypothetical protein
MATTQQTRVSLALTSEVRVILKQLAKQRGDTSIKETARSVFRLGLEFLKINGCISASEGKNEGNVRPD